MTRDEKEEREELEEKEERQEKRAKNAGKERDVPENGDGEGIRR